MFRPLVTSKAVAERFILSYVSLLPPSVHFYLYCSISCSFLHFSLLFLGFMLQSHPKLHLYLRITPPAALYSELLCFVVSCGIYYLPPSLYNNQMS
ncbi:hypothetical protein GDO81_024853 [Engystomops pustulosus]|uniref:Uncharacterized protein n=1 Tax=Engystomops pustulosus TaxID=76066 RepID=A0AAV6YNG1_ENGPU|nr:hypothetical protein GDO81_024853 [Engystomops pustulosus]